MQTPSVSLWFAARDGQSSVTLPLTRRMVINSHVASAVQGKKKSVGMAVMKVARQSLL